MNSHVDVVPFEAEKWDHPPLGAEIDEDGRIYARGTQDMKSVGMQYLEAIRKLVASGYKPLRSVYVTFVPDEEIGGADGVGRFVESEIFKSLSIAVVLDEGRKYLVKLINITRHADSFFSELFGFWLVQFL